MEALFLILVAYSFVLSVTLVPWVAGQKGRNTIAWAVVSLLVSPLLALIALAAIPSRPTPS